jgi:signal transduction histidine kinase
MNVLINAIDVLSEAENQKMPLGKSSSDLAFLPRIRIRTELLSSNCVCVRIADNGTGMTENVKKRLFEPFFTTKPVGKGTGLGLAIGYQIVDKHQGAIRCVSAPGEGTEFWIEVPVRQQSEQSVSKVLPAVGVKLN